jgi:putative peptidoglycan lipid II flippase
LIRQGASSFGFELDAGARRRLPRIAAAALLMGALLWLVAGLALAHHGLLAQAITLLAVIAAGIAAYGALLAAFDVTGWREVVNAVRQREGGDLRP